MRTQSDAKENSASELNPSFVPTKPWRVVFVRSLAGYRLKVKFVDGLEGIVDMSALVHSKNAGVFAKLVDQTQFSLVRLEHGAVTWPGELDLAPDAMHSAIKAGGEWVLT